jgi:hypothetical protein
LEKTTEKSTESGNTGPIRAQESAGNRNGLAGFPGGLFFWLRYTSMPTRQSIVP